MNKKLSKKDKEAICLYIIKFNGTCPRAMCNSHIAKTLSCESCFLYPNGERRSGCPVAEAKRRALIYMATIYGTENIVEYLI